jgi:hypothetical protein
MGNIIKLLATAGVCVCVATLLAQATVVTYLWSQGSLNKDKVLRLLAVLHNIEAAKTAAARNSADPNQDQQQVAYDEIVRARATKSLDFDLRESAVEKGLSDLRALQTQLMSERTKYDQMKKSFETRLADLEKAATDEAIQEVQRTLETMQPKQAKEQILMMLEEDRLRDGTAAMDAVVTILKSMPLDKRKKIIGEFKSADEADKLHEILRQIRLGEPDVSLIRATRRELNGIDAPSIARK